MQGCDGGVLLYGDLPRIDSEKKSPSNADSLKEFEAVETIKDDVDEACPGPVVSCADILALAARDSVVALGAGKKGCRDSKETGADNDLPSPFASLQQTISNFSAKGFTAREMVALSEAHSVGLAHCIWFRYRLYNRNNNLHSLVASDRKSRRQNDGDNILSSMDHQSPNRFGKTTFRGFSSGGALLRSDQELFNGGFVDDLVKAYSQDSQTFYSDFANAMVKMGDMNTLRGDKGEIR